MVVFFLKIMKIPTQKGEHLCKCTELSLKQKEGSLKILCGIMYDCDTFVLSYIAGYTRLFMNDRKRILRSLL